jgi:hypothetical protein
MDLRLTKIPWREQTPLMKVLSTCVWAAMGALGLELLTALVIVGSSPLAPDAASVQGVVSKGGIVRYFDAERQALYSLCIDVLWITAGIFAACCVVLHYLERREYRKRREWPLH